jgi:hypothetical protein
LQHWRRHEESRNQKSADEHSVIRYVRQRKAT